MKAAVALLVSIAMFGCFPHNAKHRRYAKIAEGTAVVAGIAISAIANTGADCDERIMPGPNIEDNCRTKAKWASTLGVSLILAGMLGFVATVSSAEEEEVKQANAARTQTSAEEKSQLKLPPGVTPPPKSEGEGTAEVPSGSASPSPSAPHP